MKLVRYHTDDGTIRPGVLLDGAVTDVTELSPAQPTTVDSFQSLLETVTDDGSGPLADAVTAGPESKQVERSETTLAPPLATAGRLFALGGVYTQHSRKRGHTPPKVPSQWFVPPTAVVGQNDAIELRGQVSDSVLPAVELGVVIGKRGRNVDEADAMDHVAGYTVVNDVTARTDWPGPMGYKLMDTFSPCGPHVTPADDVPSPTSLDMSIHQNGECICQGTTASMRFALTYLVRFVSTIVKLRPGDIISTGDPGRVQEILVSGEMVTTTVEDIGTLRNPVKKR